PVLEGGDRFEAVNGDAHVVAGVFENEAEHLENVGIVVDDQQLVAHVRMIDAPVPQLERRKPSMRRSTAFVACRRAATGVSARATRIAASLRAPCKAWAHTAASPPLDARPPASTRP